MPRYRMKNAKSTTDPLKIKQKIRTTVEIRKWNSFFHTILTLNYPKYIGLVPPILQHFSVWMWNHPNWPRLVFNLYPLFMGSQHMDRYTDRDTDREQHLTSILLSRVNGCVCTVEHNKYLYVLTCDLPFSIFMLK